MEEYKFRDLQDCLYHLALLVEAPKGDYIQIIYGNAWEFQFYFGKTAVFYELEDADTNIRRAAEKFYKRVLEAKQKKEISFAKK